MPELTFRCPCCRLLVSGCFTCFCSHELLMLSNCLSVFSYNEIEYFTYVNIIILSLALFYLTLFMVIYSSALLLNSVFYNDVAVEVFMTLVSFAYILAIISPGLLLFLDYDFISSLTNFNVYVLGYQWAWNYNVMFNNVSYTFDQLVTPSSAFSSSVCSCCWSTCCDALLSSPMLAFALGLSVQLTDLGCGFGACFYPSMSMLLSSGTGFYPTSTSMSPSSAVWNVASSSLAASFIAAMSYFSSSSLSSSPLAALPYSSSSLAASSSLASSFLCSSPAAFLEAQAHTPLHASFYLCLFSSYLLLPLYATISMYVNSFDVIHSFGYHCLGCKSDCIPGRVNHVSSLQLHFPGHFISYCYELCGLAHTSMLSSIAVLP
jgi:heme/copper-type cytochrome/quinol oxidase subunit 2